MACIIPAGIIEPIGEFDSGKTSFALENGYPPQTTVFVDNDVKGKATVKQLIEDGLTFADYIDFTEMTYNKNSFQVYQEVENVIARVEKLAQKTKIDVLIWDTWQTAGDSFVEYVRKYPDRFVVANQNGNYWTGSSQIVTGNQYKYAALHEAAVLNRLQKIIPLIFLVSHTKNNYVNGVVAGVKAASSRTMNRVPYFRVWLRRNPVSQIPIALTMKRINKKIFDEKVGGLRTISILPDKIVPNIILPEETITKHNDRSLWDTIARYYVHPAGLREPLKEEMLNEEENAILSGTMTKEQRLAWLYAIKQQKLDEESEKLLLQAENKTKAVELQAAGKGLMDIAKELNVPLADVVKWTTASE